MADTPVNLVFRRAPSATPGPVHLVFGEDGAMPPAALRVFDGTEWLAAAAKRWDGATWAPAVMRGRGESSWLPAGA